MMKKRKLIALSLAIIFIIIVPVAVINVNSASQPWLTKQQIISDMKNMANNSPSATYFSIGKTVENNDIWAFQIGTNDQAKMLIDGAHHGHEMPTSHTIYKLMEWLVGGSAEADDVMSRLQIVLVPIVNYDNTDVPGVGIRTNANHVDLNRNFVTGWGVGGSSDPTSNYYRGPYPLSEPETQAIKTFLEAEDFEVHITMHDWGGALSTNGDFKYPNWGSSIYNSKINTLHSRYQSLVFSLYGFNGHKTYSEDSYGGTRDDAYNDGNTVSALWEQTQTWGSEPENVDFNLIINVKQYHAISYVTAVSEIYGIDPTPDMTVEDWENYHQWLTNESLQYWKDNIR